MHRVSGATAFRPDLVAERLKMGDRWVDGDLKVRRLPELTDKHLESLRVWLLEQAQHYCAVLTSVEKPGSIEDRQFRRGVMDRAVGRRVIKETALYRNILLEQERRAEVVARQNRRPAIINPGMRVPVEYDTGGQDVVISVAGVEVTVRQDGTVASVKVPG